MPQSTVPRRSHSRCWHARRAMRANSTISTKNIASPPEVTRRRLYYETMEAVLSKTDKTIVRS